MTKIKTTELITEQKIDSLYGVLLKKATGYKIKETVEEYSVIDDEIKLTKKKVNVKYYPPDLSAIELIISQNKEFKELKDLSDEELEEEKQKLINQLNLFKKTKKQLTNKKNSY